MNGRTLNALCAIDAMGVGSMYRLDTTIASTCRLCSTPITIGTTRQGTVLSHAQPAGAVVWYDLADTVTAATSCYPSMRFFCCNDHLRQWLVMQPTARTGYRLTVDEALEVGRAIFGPVLANDGAAGHAKD
jgi:hypothetical protein